MSEAASSRRSNWPLWGATTAVALAGGGVTYWVVAPSATERIQTALPPLPDLSSAPEILQQSLTEAYAEASNSASLASLSHYARLLQANDFAAEAEATWRVLLREEDSDAQAAYYLAHLRRNAGDIGETTVLLQQTTEHAPDYAPAWLLLGDMALKSGRFDTAESFYGERLRMLPGDPYSRLGLARISLQQGEREAGRKQLLELVQDHSDFASAHNLLAQLYREDGNERLAETYRWNGYRSGRFVAAPDPWLEALTVDCHTPARLFTIGMVAFQTGDQEQARAIYERAVKAEPDNPGNHELLGDLYRKLKQPELARESLRTSIQLSHQEASVPPLLAFIHLAAVERELGDIESSLKTASQGIKAYPNSPELPVELGLSREVAGDLEGAREAYQMSLAISPNDTAANFHQGEWWLRMDNTEAAIPHFLAALTHQPTFAPALRYLIQYYLGTGRLGEAKRHADVLLGAFYGDEEVRQLVGICYLRLGRAALEARSRDAAVAYFAKAWDLHPTDVDIAYEWGTIALADGNSGEALPALELLLDRRPQDPTAHLFLAQANLMEGRRRTATELLETGLKLAEQQGQSGTAQNMRMMLESIRR